MSQLLSSSNKGHALATQDIHKVIAIMTENRSINDIEPGNIADMVIRLWENGNTIDVRIRWAAVQEIKQMAREILRKYQPSDPESEAYQGAFEFKSLQSWYPLPGKSGVYRRLERLVKNELEWNVNQLRKHADACQQHADALQQYAAKKYSN